MQKFSTQDNGSEKPKNWSKLVLIGLIAVVLLILVFNSFTVVNEGFIGVKYQFGRIVRSDMTAGLNFHIPFIEEIQQVDTREQVYSITADAYTSDTQTVDTLQLKLNY